MKALLRAIKDNPRLSSALAGVLGGGAVGFKQGRDHQSKKPDPLLLAALQPGAKDHMDEALASKGYGFTGEDLRRISQR